jgi:hypothetical protein
VIPVISIFMGSLLGLSIFLFVTQVETTSKVQPSINVDDAVSVCKDGIIKYALGAFPGAKTKSNRLMYPATAGARSYLHNISFSKPRPTPFPY